ncbi:MAG: pantoate--beta-alanine ligase [Proteobacteria bacterium]|nr:pantoate--beta-alanine ligase [Pseudomonadota bacterium]
MLVSGDISDIRTARWQDPQKTWGFVPTMGMLHEGHISLVKRAIEENDGCIVSIYVNPTQFNNPIDYDTYPKDMDNDLAKLEACGVDVVFTPIKALMYPHSFSSNVTLTRLAAALEGAARPGHFDGVTTVVAKLFNITQPTRAYFGQKDAQQLLIIQQMVQDLNFNLEIVPCGTFREKSGLAMSSRNNLLSTEQKKRATVLYHALQRAKQIVQAGERDAKKIILEMTRIITDETKARIVYISINDAESLEEMETLSGKVLISLAVFFGEVRLIDNFVLTV